MLQIVVQRQPADKQGQDISDPLLTTVDAQIERGQAEINQNCSSRMIVNGNCPASDYIEPGSTAQVTDMERGVYFAVVDSWALTLSINESQFSATSAVTFERE